MTHLDLTDDAAAERSRALAAPMSKRAMRAVWRRLPRIGAMYGAGKLFTRTVMRPSHVPRPVTVRFAGEVEMQLDLADFVANDLYCLDAQFESTTLALWRRLARRATSILDLGSHIGTFALVAAAANRRARVIAVEALAENYRQLERHGLPYANLRPVQVAVADHSGPLWFCPSRENSGGGYVSRTPPPDGRGQLVEAQSLLDLCRSQDLPRVDLMKVDLEGYEHTLLGRENAFWDAYRPRHLIVEVRRAHRRDRRDEALFAAMRRRGYTARRVQGLFAVPLARSYDLANWHFALKRTTGHGAVTG